MNFKCFECGQIFNAPEFTKGMYCQDCIDISSRQKQAATLVQSWIDEIDYITSEIEIPTMQCNEPEIEAPDLEIPLSVKELQKSSDSRGGKAQTPLLEGNNDDKEI